VEDHDFRGEDRTEKRGAGSAQDRGNRVRNGLPRCVLQRGVRHKRNFLPQSGGECWAKYSARCRVLNAKRMWRAALAWAGPHYQTEIASHSDMNGDKPLFLTVIQPDSGACLTYTALSVRVHASKLEDNSH
jgi:hypothetical protein